MSTAFPGQSWEKKKGKRKREKEKGKKSGKDKRGRCGVDPPGQNKRRFRFNSVRKQLNLDFKKIPT